MRIEASSVDEPTWNEFRAFTLVVEHIRPFIIDYLALRADYEALAAVEDELSAELTSILAGGMISIQAGVEVNARAQQLVSNFLGACSAFRDRAASRLSQQFGSTATEAATLKTTVSRVFEKSFAYRLLYALRNYAQHHEMPVSFVPINADRAQDGTMRARIAILLQLDALQASRRLNAKLRTELNAVGSQQVKLCPLLAEYLTGHQEIMRDLLILFVPRLREMVHYATAFCREYEVPDDVVSVVWEGDDPAAGPHTQRRYLLCGFDEMVSALDLLQLLEELIPSAAFHNDCEHAII